MVNLPAIVVDDLSGDAGGLARGRLRRPLEGDGASAAMIVFIVHNLPHTFVVVALLIVLLGAVTIVRTPTDIFPDVTIPVASVIWALTARPSTTWRRASSPRPSVRSRRA